MEGAKSGDEDADEDEDADDSDDDEMEIEKKSKTLDKKAKRNIKLAEEELKTNIGQELDDSDRYALPTEEEKEQEDIPFQQKLKTFLIFSFMTTCWPQRLRSLTLRSHLRQFQISPPCMSVSSRS